MRKLSFLFFILLFAGNTYAGVSYQVLTTKGAAAVPIKLEGEGIYNLIINIEFLKEPYDKKPYNTDNYSKLINRLRVEWSDVAVQTILANPNVKLTEMANLKKSLQVKLDALIQSSKSKHKLPESAEIVYSITSFAISKPEKGK